MPNPVVHFEIIGKDAKQLQEFYSAVFGWKIDAANPMNYGMIEAQDGHGIGGGVGPGEANQSGVPFYIEVDDPQAYLDKVVARGGKVTMPVTDVMGSVTMAQFTDPEGHRIGIVKAGSM
jgi:predicted enzyme related to lactoylglutathione lyase